jgi:nitrogen fixation/metabolism regulation signal transduction histidine kinase
VTREEALAALSASSAHLRGQAARAIGGVGNAGDLDTIRRALKTETVSYVQYALQDSLKELTNKSAPLSDEGEDFPDVPPEVRRQIYSKAVEWVTGTLLHEVASPVGLATLSAKREIKEGWEDSATRRHLETIHRVFDAVEMLKNAAGVPRPQQFELAALLQNFIETEVPTALLWISSIGPKPFVITSDPALIRMVVGNGIRNAVEAVANAEPAPQEHAIVINWGETEADYWISVLDRGPGIAGPVESAFAIGKSTKKHHSGFGLAIARQAVDTLTGIVTLEPARDGGAVYTARWKR